MGALVVRSLAKRHDSGWPTTPDNVLYVNASTAQTTVVPDTMWMYGFDFSDLPANIDVTGISIRIEGLKDHAGGSGDLNYALALSWDAGVSTGDTLYTDYLALTQSTFIVGGVDEDWGHTWLYSELTTADEFRVGVTTNYDSVVSTPTYHLAYLTATIHYDEDSTPTDTPSEPVTISESVVSSILHDVVYEAVGVADAGSTGASATRTPRGIQQIAQSGTAVTLFESDSTFSATAERPRRQESLGAAIQLGVSGPTLYVGDATVLTSGVTTHPYSYMQAGLLGVSDLTSEATFIDGFQVPTVEVRLSNRDYVDQSDGSDLVPKTFGEHSLDLPSVGRSLTVWGMAESGDGWKKRVVFNGDIEDVQFFDNEVIVRGIQLGTTQKAVPDIIVDENLFAYEPGSTAVDTGEEIEENRGKPVPIGIGRFDYGAVKKPEDFDAGHPFRFTAEPGPPAEALRTYSQIALFPAMMGLKHPMMPTIHVARRYRRIEGQTGDFQFQSWPWQNVLLYGSRKSSPNLSVSVGATNPGQTFALQYPNWDTRTVTDHGLYNADRYVMIWTWHTSDHGSRGMPCIKPTSDTMYSHSVSTGVEDFASLHASAGTMEQLGFPYRSDKWSDGTAQDAYGIFLNIREPDPVGINPAPKSWPGVWQVVALQMAGLTATKSATVSYDQAELDAWFRLSGSQRDNTAVSATRSPTFETLSVDNPDNCIRLDDAEDFSTINTGGSLAIQAPLDGPNLGTVRMVKFCMLWNPTTSTATSVQLFARWGPWTKWGILDVATSTAGADYNLSKNVTFNRTDYVDGAGESLPILKLSGITDRSFASFCIAPYFNSYRNDVNKNDETDAIYSQNDTVATWPNMQWKSEWSFIGRDYVRGTAQPWRSPFYWPMDVMIKTVTTGGAGSGALDVTACWLEVVHQSKLGDDSKEPLRQSYTFQLQANPSSGGVDVSGRRGPAPTPNSPRELFGTSFSYTRPNARLTTESSIYVSGKGVIDDSGELTGTANTIIEHPVDICNTLIRHYLGNAVFQARAIGSAFGSFDTARTILSGYRMTVVVNPDRAVNIKQVLAEIGAQCKSVVREHIDSVGNLQWIMYADTENPAVSDADRLYTGFTNNLIRWDNIAKGTFTTSFVPYEELSSSVTLRYGLHLPTGTWSGTMVCTPEATNFAVDAADYKAVMEFARTEYKVENPLSFDAPDVWDPAVAEDLCKWRCNINRRRRMFVEFETYANALDLEPGHVIQFDNEIGDRVKFPGEGSPNWSNHYFNVEQVSASKSAGQLTRVFVRALEVHSEP